MLSYVNLKPLMWRQEISHYPSSNPNENVEGTILKLTCALHVNCDLLLSNGAKLREFEIELSIVRGELPADEVQRNIFKERAMGGLWFLEEDDFVHGWFYFKSDNFTAVWDQVRNGGYVDCVIRLGVDPIQDDTWNGNPLSIVSASLSFARKPIADKSADQQAPRRGLFTNR